MTPYPRVLCCCVDPGDGAAVSGEGDDALLPVHGGLHGPRPLRHHSRRHALPRGRRRPPGELHKQTTALFVTSLTQANITIS